MTDRLRLAGKVAFVTGAARHRVGDRSRVDNGRGLTSSSLIFTDHEQA
jgi:hypothetical protein